jgi:putative hemolysin
MLEYTTGLETPGSSPGRGQAPNARIEARSGGLIVRLAESEAEIRAAQELRYRVFFEEQGAAPSPEVARARRDVDRFDDAADHLVAIDTTQTDPRRAVVGAYRLIRREASRQSGGFYTASEFDIARLEAWPGAVLELGRSCVDPAYRNKRAINLLWRGIVGYSQAHGVELLFGCGSLPGADPDCLGQQLSYLHHYHLAPRYIRPRATASRFVAMDRLPKDAIDPARALASLPPLIKGYLRIGGFVGDGAVVDEEFGCTDVCVVMKTDLMSAKYARHYGYTAETSDAA